MIVYLVAVECWGRVVRAVGIFVMRVEEKKKAARGLLTDEARRSRNRTWEWALWPTSRI
jgi:hypothetical protein